MTRVSHDGLSRKGRFFIVHVIPFAIILAGVLAVINGARDLNRAKASVNWPVSQGVIVESKVSTSRLRHTTGRHGRSTSYRARIRYQFEVDGKEIIGKHIAYGEIFYSRKAAVKRVNQYPESSSVNVYYMPGHPEVSVLEPGVHPGVYFFPGIGLVVLIAGVFAATRFPRMFFDAEDPTG
mgnify:CR=1 FL=1